MDGEDGIADNKTFRPTNTPTAKINVAKARIDLETFQRLLLIRVSPLPG
jgi:hypothetical protein